MCGISVAIDWEGAESAVRQLVAGILHRGDVTDPVISPRRNTAMCTRRLRIVDGEHAIQPQASPDGRLLVSFNGEIYNHAELRAELVQLGVAFKTESDTEVLAAALQFWGVEALRRLVGMYAFVAVDATTGDFLAARDPFGVKPLYLINTGTGFLFCSEIRPLLSTAETGDVMLLPPGYLLTRTQCIPYVSAITASAVPLVPEQPRRPRPASQRSRLYKAASRPSRRDNVQWGHRQHSDYALRKAIPSGNAGLFSRWPRCPRLRLCCALCGSDRIRFSARPFLASGG